MKKILVIEDDEMVNAGMCFNIEKEGYEPISVFDVTCARPNIKNKEVIAIIMDKIPVKHIQKMKLCHL